MEFAKQSNNTMHPAKRQNGVGELRYPTDHLQIMYT